MRHYESQPSGTVDRARSLRRNSTDAERTLWRAVREAFPAHKWRRQVPVGPYYADLMCFTARLIVEVDGGQHAEAMAYDERRAAFLEREGYRVLRLWNNDVLESTEGVLEAISNSLSRREREGAPNARRGEGDHSPILTLSPSPRAASQLAPLPVGEG